MSTNAVGEELAVRPSNRLKQFRQMLGSAREKWYAQLFRRYARRNSVAFRRSLEAAGFQVARTDDYYSPLPSAARLKADASRWNRPSSLHGVEYDLAAMKSTLTELLACYLNEFLAYPPYADVLKMG